MQFDALSSFSHSRRKCSWGESREQFSRTSEVWDCLTAFFPSCCFILPKWDSQNVISSQISQTAYLKQTVTCHSSLPESSQLVSGEPKQVPCKLEISCLGSCCCEIMWPFTNRFHPCWEIHCHRLYLFQWEHVGSSGTPDIIDRKIILNSLLPFWSLLITCHRVVSTE